MSQTYIPAYHNRKVVAYTIAIHALFLLFLFFVTRNATNPVIEESYIEVNLGDVDDAFGKTLPTRESGKGESTTSLPSSSKTSKTQLETSEQSALNNVSDVVQNNDANIATQAKVNQQPQNKPSTQVEKKTSIPVPPQPKPQPIAIYRGEEQQQEGDGSVAYDSYGEEGGSQGITQGVGDMGATNGSVSSTNYGSISVVGGLGNRRILSALKLSSDFDEEGIVQLKVTFNKKGKVGFIVQDIANSSTTNKQLVDIAFKNARRIILNEDSQAPNEQLVLFRFIFKIRL